MIRNPTIYFFQVVSLLGIWALLLGIGYFLSNSLIESFDHSDILTATFAISALAVIVYSTLVGVLTYVFVGLQRGRKK